MRCVRRFTPLLKPTVGRWSGSREKMKVDDADRKDLEL